jgi:glycosyltransferase involved in cell wall biosynthesis
MNCNSEARALPVAGAATSRLPKIAVVTTAAPPSASGQARVLGQLLVPARTAPPVYLTDQLQALEAGGERFGSYHSLGAPKYLLASRINWNLLHGLNAFGGLLRGALSRANEITAILQKEPVKVMIGCTASPFDLPAAYIASRRLKIPFVVYLFDDPVYQWETGIYRRLARFWEPIWGRGAAAFIAPNEVLAKDVRARLPNANISIVRNPVDPAAFPTPATGKSDLRSGSVTDRVWRLLYTGSVYSAQASAFRNLNTALNRLQGRFILDVYTAQTPAALAANGLDGPYVHHHPFASQSIALSLQQNADILFLPLAFNSPIPEVILSSAPAKLGEYLAAGSPILVHAPAGSFVSELLRKADAGVVVDTSDPDRLVEALITIANSASLRHRIVKNAANLAEEFYVERARDAFCAVISALDR